jgi:hypothetical protein
VLVLAIVWWNATRARTVTMGTTQVTSGFRVTVSSWHPSEGVGPSWAMIASCPVGEGGPVADLSAFRLESAGGSVEARGSQMRSTAGGCVEGRLSFPATDEPAVAVVFAGSPTIRWSLPDDA